MTSPDAKADASVVRRLFEEMLNKRHLELAHEIFAPNHVLHDPQLQAAAGPQAMIDTLQPFTRDLAGRYTVDEVLVSGDRVIARWTGWGEHVGALNGLVPTGRKVGPVTGIAIYRLERGRIAETWQVHDTLGLMQQMGVVPSA